MGKILLRIILVLAVVVGILAVVGTFLPRQYSVTSTQTIDAPVEQVFEQINVTDNWKRWSPWSPERVDGLTVNFSGPPQGNGAVMAWTDPRPDNRFDGRMEITKSTPRERIEYAAMLGQVPMDGFFELTAVDGKTQVSWTAAGELPSGAAYGLLSLYYEGFLKTELDASLARIKDNLNTNTQNDNSNKITPADAG